MALNTIIPVRVVAGPSFYENGFAYEATPVKIVTGETTSMSGIAQDVKGVNVANANYGVDELGQLKKSLPVYVVDVDVVPDSAGNNRPVMPVRALIGEFESLPAPTWSGALTFDDAASTGTVIATLTNPVSGETLSLSPDDGKVVLVGNELRKGATASTPGNPEYTFTRTKAGAINSPRATALSITVT